MSAGRIWGGGITTLPAPRGLLLPNSPALPPPTPPALKCFLTPGL